MVSLSKEEIASNLLDYCILFSKIKMYPDRKISNLYNEIIMERYQQGMNIDNYNENSYLVMLRVYCIVNYLKLFSYYEEHFFNSIDDRNLDFSRFKKNIKDGGIFLDGDGSEFSNKKIILYIRNAFNHNDDPNHNKFNISRNGKYIEVHLLDVRTDELKKLNPNDKKSFHIKISYNDFLQLFDMTSKEIQNYFISFYTSSIEGSRPDIITNNFIDGLSINRILLQRKVMPEILQELEKISYNHSLSKEDKLLQICDILSVNNVVFKIEQYELDNYQKDALKIVFSGEEKINPEVLDFVLGAFINSYTPLGMCKTNDIRNEIALLNLMCSVDITYREIENSVNRIVKNKKDMMNEIEKNIVKRFNGDVGNLIRLDNTFSVYMKKSAFLTYISYVISNCYNDDEIVVDDISREHIRNSLTHGWFFINQNNVIELYDNNNRRRNDYNFYWHESIPFVDMLNAVISRGNSGIMAGINKRK